MNGRYTAKLLLTTSRKSVLDSRKSTLDHEEESIIHIRASLLRIVGEPMTENDEKITPSRDIGVQQLQKAPTVDSCPVMPTKSSAPRHKSASSAGVRSSRLSEQVWDNFIPPFMASGTPSVGTAFYAYIRDVCLSASSSKI